MRVDERRCEHVRSGCCGRDRGDDAVGHGDGDAVAACEPPFEHEAVRAAVAAEEGAHATAARSRTGLVRGQEVVEDRHPHRETGAHLLEDQRVGRVGDAAVDLDAAVDRPGVHHLLPGPDALRRHAPARRVLAQARDERRLHPLALHPEDVDDVGVRDRADLGRGLAAHRLDPARDQRRRADERRVRADEPERLDQRARDPAVQDVADDRDVEPLELSEGGADREEIEQRLGRVLVLAVAGVHDGGARVARDQLRRADLRVPDDDRVRVVLRERQHGVLERLPLVDGRACGFQRHHVGREPLRRQLEAGRRAGRGLEEETEHQLPPQRRQLLVHPLERPRGLEDPLDIVAGQVTDRKQVPHDFSSGAPTRRIRSAPSVSASSTWIRSLRAVGRFLPT